MSHNLADIDKFLETEVWGSRENVVPAKKCTIRLFSSNALEMKSDSGKLFVVGRQAFIDAFDQPGEYFDKLVYRLMNGEDEIVLES